ncbi:zinc finger BED domain-containing protein 5-like [Homarus americanus]|uniref:zinc finger BED domain-containing protein 5-like n=1 Tax=Homarus americanus TaxID=6706 RepID=UPI001C488B00|nr:zinc finger BED domain-containing protein 5-like [Homarus americanus]
MATSVVKKRKYNDEYINYGFISILADGIEKPQRELCFKVLGNDSMRPSKLKHHLTTLHHQCAQRDTDFFKSHERSLGKQRLDESVAFQQQNLSVVEASYEVSIETAKKKKAHTIGETLIKPCALKMVMRVLGEASERKIQQISLSDDTVKRRISEMSDDIITSVEAWIQSMKPSSFTPKCDGFPRNWQRKISAGNVAMFENLSAVLDEIEEDHLLDPSLKNEIIQHLKSLESELKRYFPEFEEEDGKLVRNPFSGTLDITAIPDDVQDEFLDLRNDSATRDLYEEKSLTLF